MESKRAQKLSKATVATILAASGVIVAIPQPSHAYSFKDINPLSDYYEPILDLASRKIVTGYSDGTFKPNQSITREDAAKMLALTIDINIKNPKKPGFKDVPMNSPNYRYIAALAEAGIINGYPDKTFKPKEPITRGQMAKILTLGFEFGVSTKLNHGFKDVSSKDGYAYFIQTLYDLNITKGKTAISYDPLNSVTRAQMATFIWRAEKADRGNPVYTVGDIIGNQIYINGVAHTIAPHLRSILSAANKNILKDATIEGDFSGNRINNISRLTINASGTSWRLLAMDGEYSSFAGELVVNGSYVRFKNITFTGRVELAEAPRRSLANLSNVRVASVGNVAQFIDWSKPTVDKNEDFLNPIDKENLVDKPDPTKPNKTYKDRMPNLKKYVDFEGSDVRHLYVTADHAFLKADYDIDRLYVQGNVANFELYASPNAMYIDTDYNVNIYGVHDIRYVYKNTLKNVHLRSDATYDNYYITSSNGFTNISDHTYITDAIIPPNKTVNDVFDDFETDEPQIGHIEDTNGKPVSRDPVGDTVIKDVTSPRITDLTVSAGGTIADVSLIADEDGTYYYVVKQADEKAPSINEIKTGGTKHAGKGPIVMDEPAKFQIVGLDTKTDYVIYAIVIDAADNVSEKESTEFSTIDNRPPTLLLKPTTPQPAGGKRLEFTFEKVSEPGTIYYYIREGSSGNPPEMSVDDVIKNATATITATKPGDIIETSRIHGSKPNLAAIEPNRTYYVYAVMVDSTGNKMTVVENKAIKSAMPDEAQPFVADSAQLRVVDKDKGIFEFTASEELDKTTAENVDNYTLTGTAVLNITGQKTIKPSKVEVNKNKVRFTIPALNSLVKGDTIRVTVSKDVLDLAENEFEHTDRYPEDQNAPRNEAYYTHSDDTLPTIKINKVVVEKDRNLVEFEAPTKAGTYYYMILPENFNFDEKGITPRDFIEEFEQKSINNTTKFGAFGQKIYTGNLLNQYGPAELGVNTKSVDIDYDRLYKFETYSIYMVLKDRAGLVSNQIVSAPIVADSKAPLIYGLEVKAELGSNNNVEFNFTSDEAGELAVIPVRKYIFNTQKNIYELNSQFFNPDGTLIPITNVYPSTTSDNQREAFKAVAARAGGSKRAKFIKGTNKVNISGLAEHQEYGFYVAADDMLGVTGNFTIFSRKDEANPPSPDEPNGKQMLLTTYTDGTKPFIDKSGVVVRSDDNGETKFTITFNEAIMRQSTITNYNESKTFKLSDIIAEIGGTTGTAIDNAYEIVSYNRGSNTYSQSRLIIKPIGSTNADKTIEIKMKSELNDAYDYLNKNAFDISKIGKYTFRNLTFGFVSIQLLYPTGNSSELAEVMFDLTSLDKTFEAREEVTYYYEAHSKLIPEASIKGITPEDVITNSSSSESGSLTKGIGTFAPGLNVRITEELENSKKFVGGDWIVIVLVDKYGNKKINYQKIGYLAP
ncbi:MAG: S-layer homology domain-containing protein [Solibacillus sp.]